MAEKNLLIVKARVKQELHPFRVNELVFKSLDKILCTILGQSKIRANRNGRKTIQPHDL